MSEPPAILRRKPSSGAWQDLFDQVHKEMKTAAKPKNSNDLAAKYVCLADLTRIWSNTVRIAAFIQPSPTLAQLHSIQENMIIIFSTLVWIGAAKCLSEFTQRLFKESGAPLITDSNLPLEQEQLDFLRSEPFLQEQFYDNQFRFKPACLIYGSCEVAQKLHPKARLPFETVQKEVGSGGYGVVDRVGISPKYIRRSPGNWSSDSVYYVACKRMRAHKDFKKEKENLQILKESFQTVHKRIMLHLMTIEYGEGECILFPYAPWGDLEVFLHCGHSSDGEVQYNFDDRFSQIKNAKAILPLLGECAHLAGALKWLHDGIPILNTSKKVVCAHMDLKPANILIDSSDDGPVGRWMITDFGISVLRDESPSPGPKSATIHDYWSHVTLNTRPTRPAGTHQAPEVAVAEKLMLQANRLSPNQRGVGRKSDIWSFGCILSEILAFSLGQVDLVREFQEARERDHEDDYFYTEHIVTEHDASRRTFLKAPDQTTNKVKNYKVRESVHSWLQGLCFRMPNSQKWVDCYVGTIKTILEVKTDKRPDAEKLIELLQHLMDHCEKSSGVAADVCNSNCPILNPERPQQPPRTPPPIPGPWSSPKAEPSRAMLPSEPASSSTPQSHTVFPVHKSPTGTIPRKPVDSQEPNMVYTSDAPTPGIVRTTTDQVEPLHLGTRHNTMGPSNQDRRPKLSPILEARPLIPTLQTATPRPGPKPFPVRNAENVARRDLGPGSSDSHFSTFWNAKPRHAHGLLTSPSVPMDPNLSTKVVRLPKPPTNSLKVDLLAISASGDTIRIACVSRSTIILYGLDATNHVPRYENSISIDHPNDAWKGLSLAGNYLVAWGFYGQRLLHFFDIKNPKAPKVFNQDKIAMLQSATVSEHGVMAWISGSQVFFTTLENDHEPVQLSSLHNKEYTDIAFNDTGQRLFAWAYGKIDSLYVWECPDRTVKNLTESESHYEFEQRGKPENTRLLPYNTHLGSLVIRPNKAIFPAHVNHSSLRGQQEIRHCLNDIDVHELEIGCIFNDHSLLTVEKRQFHRHLVLREYTIEYKATHILLPPKNPLICRVKSDVTAVSKMKAIKQGPNIVVIICNKNATVEFITAVPQ